MSVAAAMKNKRCQTLYRSSPGPSAPDVYFNGEISLPAPPTVAVDTLETLVLDQSITVEVLPDPEVETETLVVYDPCSEED